MNQARSRTNKETSSLFKALCGVCSYTNLLVSITLEIFFFLRNVVRVFLNCEVWRFRVAVTSLCLHYFLTVCIFCIWVDRKSISVLDLFICSYEAPTLFLIYVIFFFFFWTALGSGVFFLYFNSELTWMNIFERKIKHVSMWMSCTQTWVCF